MHGHTRSDCGKNRYSDKKTAQTMANFLKKRDSQRRSRGRVKGLRAYQCPDCGGWHLTSDYRRK